MLLNRISLKVDLDEVFSISFGVFGLPKVRYDIKKCISSHRDYCWCLHINIEFKTVKLIFMKACSKQHYSIVIESVYLSCNCSLLADLSHSNLSFKTERRLFCIWFCVEMPDFPKKYNHPGRLIVKLTLSIFWFFQSSMHQVLDKLHFYKF